MERAEIAGIVQATTTKAVLLLADGVERWIPRKFCKLLAGELVRGGYAVLSIPLWILENDGRGKSANVEPETPPAAAIPADMLKRLIFLCHPDKHGDSKASTIATEWLLSLRG